MSELLHIQPWHMDDLTLNEYVSAWYYLRSKNEEVSGDG